MSATAQPQWKFVANIGDRTPLLHGGYFVFVEETGVYPPEAAYYCVDYEDDSDKPRGLLYRVVLDRCTYIDSVLSDNRFHPDKPAWFASPESERANRPQDTTYLSDVASCSGIGLESLILSFCSGDPVLMALAYKAVYDYHGWENGDDNPLVLSHAGAERWLKNHGVIQ